MITMLDRCGLCSVTFRELTPDAVVRTAAEAGLTTIEWGADVHVPDVAEAVRVRALTEDAGLRVAALGSYYRVGEAEPGAFAELLEIAVALGAPRIRVWAGSIGSAEADQAHRDRVVADAKTIGELAAAADILIGFEFHGRTLTDTLDSTQALLQAIDHPNVASYWQPPVDLPDDDAIDGLRAVLPHLCAVHVFSWWPGSERLPLNARGELWSRVAEVLTEADADVDLLLEFIPGDAPEKLAGQARMLRDLLGRSVPS